MENNKFIVYGPKPLFPLEDGSAGEYLYKCLKRYENVATCMTNPDNQHTVSYRELLKNTCMLAESLRKNGYSKNTVISICSENSIYFLQPVIAALYLGITVVPANQNYTEREFIHTYSISKPEIIFCSKQTLPKVLKLKQKLPCIRKIIILDDTVDTQDAETFNNFISRSVDGNFDFNNFMFPKFNRDEQVAVILCSSGTTGIPKGVMITHKNLMTKFNQCKDPQSSVGDFLKPGDPVLNFLPLFHGFGFMMSLGYFVMGLHIIITQGYNEKLILGLIEKYRIQSAIFIPAVMIRLVQTPVTKNYDLSSLIEVGCGSAPLSSEVCEQLKQKLNVKHVRQGYGLTEATLMVTLTPLNSKKFASTGKLVTFVRAKIVDLDTQKPLGPNYMGEICLKGELIMKRYAGDEEATKNTIDEDGWLHTGDVGYYDEDEYFYIVDRIKELIKYKSFQVAPAEIEALLYHHPGVKEVAVVGKPDILAGELPAAFIVKREDVDVSKEAIHDFLKGKVSNEKLLRGGVYFINSIPRNATGKVIRKELVTLLQKTSKL